MGEPKGQEISGAQVPKTGFLGAITATEIMALPAY
jgi:hypothetical protein